MCRVPWDWDHSGSTFQQLFESRSNAVARFYTGIRINREGSASRGPEGEGERGATCALAHHLPSRRPLVGPLAWDVPSQSRSNGGAARGVPRRSGEGAGPLEANPQLGRYYLSHSGGFESNRAGA